jgi:putative N6-adenine-specific DNA methylase
MSGASIHRYFVTCSPGLEECLRTELSELGLDGESTAGGVNLRGPLSALWKASFGSRLAESIRLRLKPFIATNFTALEAGLSKLPFHAYLPEQSIVDVRVTCGSSQLYHSDAVAERVYRALQRLGRGQAPAETNSKPNTETNGRTAALEPDESSSVRTLFVRIHRNEVTVSVDASGERLHRRGYRTHVGQAPIRETLAAAAARILQASAPHRLSQVWDPCCGSGTMLAEWMLTSSRMWPAFARTRERRYAFEDWPVHREEEFAEWKAATRRDHGDRTVDGLSAFGSDRDAKTLEAARHNLENARVLPGCTLFAVDFQRAQSEIPTGTAVLSNLPYGVRLKGGQRESQGAFGALDTLLAARRDLRPALVISNALPPSNRHPWQPAARFANGGLAVTAWVLP